MSLVNDISSESTSFEFKGTASSLAGSLQEFPFASLFRLEGLQRLDQLFLSRLERHDTGSFELLLAYRRGGHGLGTEQISTLLLTCAPVLEELIAEIFGIQEITQRAQAAALSHDAVFEFKREFVQRRARKSLTKIKDEMPSFAVLDAWLIEKLNVVQKKTPDHELAVARLGLELLADAKNKTVEIEKLVDWCVRALSTPEGQAVVGDWASFRIPKTLDPDQLVPVVRLEHDPAARVHGPAERFRRRDGFDLTDQRMTDREVRNEIHYCILCHDHDGDFCSKGFPEKKGQPDKGIKTNTLGVTLTGCPLDEKISEMHTLKKQGFAIAALAMIMADNPMCPVTGHRICNDCMKACVYQKQEPVNIPQIETHCLTDVLGLPWGVEIYDLLTRWNPLRARQWLPKPYNGLKVLICGMGPAGFTLAHHLSLEGFAVVGVEGREVQRVPTALLDRPIKHYSQLLQLFDENATVGFGGVAESGITARWDKNFLKLIYLSLVRRRHFQVFGGVRFGGTITVEDAWKLGFDHLAIAVGAGLPQALAVPGSLAPGMRQANDFLMTLQLAGADKPHGLANLQLRLPAVVIGGGLTAVDTATEVQAYYIVQVEKIFTRYQILVEAYSPEFVRRGLDELSLNTLDEFLAHAREILSERARAKHVNEIPNFLPLIQRWGGVTIVYRRSMQESPAYTRNHEELTSAMEEGIYYADCLDPKEARRDKHGHVESMVFSRQARDPDGRWRPTTECVTLPARAMLIATGSRPNVIYEFEHKGHFTKAAGHYQTHREVDGRLEAIPVAAHVKIPEFGPFTSYQLDQKRVSFVGDTHPVFHGSVVGAVASGLRTYPKIVEHFGRRTQELGDDNEYTGFRRHMQDLLEARVVGIKHLASKVIEITVHAPLAARHWHAGQFFRLQTLPIRVPSLRGPSLRTEALALSGSKVDRERGTVVLIVHERGASGRMIRALKPGDPIALMGPTGVRIRIGENETVMIVTDGFGHAHIRSTGVALRARGCRVLHIAMFERASDVYLREDLEAAADVTIWITREGRPITVRRSEDRSATGDAVDIVRRYAAGEMGETMVTLDSVQQLMILGSIHTVRAFKHARDNDLASFFKNRPMTLASTNTPIQCGLKGVCSQCLHWQIDPVTGERTKAVFGCSWQDQPLDMVDLDNLEERLGQNRLQEHLTNLWLDLLLDRPAAHVSPDWREEAEELAQNSVSG